MNFPTSNTNGSKPQIPQAHINVLFFTALIAMGVVLWLVAMKTGLFAW